MKTIHLIACAILVAGWQVSAEENATQEVSIRFSLDLDDGSHLIGRPVIESIPVQTSFASLDIPLKVIRSISFGGDNATASMMLRNGDKVTGAIRLEPLAMETVFGDITIPIGHIRNVRVSLSGGPMPPGEGVMSFGGVNWTPWRTTFEIRGDKLVSLPQARPGFDYGHGGNGRGAALVSNIGSPDWRDYGIELEIGMTGVDPSFNPHGLPLHHRGASIGFHVVDARESWNEPGTSGYSLNINGDGKWSVSCIYNSYCKTPKGYGSPTNDGHRVLAEGEGLAAETESGRRVRIEIRGTHIQIWVDDDKLVDLHDSEMHQEIGGRTLDHGGVTIGWGWECMGWIRNFSAYPL